MSTTHASTSTPRGTPVRSSVEATGITISGDTSDGRLRLLGQLRASLYDLGEHGDTYSRAWNAGVQHAIGVVTAALFPLPTPTLTVRFPVDDVCRGLREMAESPATMRGVVRIDLSDVEDAPDPSWDISLAGVR